MRSKRNDDDVVPFARRLVTIAGPLALAAAVVLWIVAGRNGETTGPLLPEYVVSATSHQVMRGPTDPAPSATLQLRGDGPFEVVVRPSTNAGTKIVAYAFAIGEGEPNPIDAKIEIAPEGSIRIRGRAKALEGAREIRVVVTTPESFKRFDDALTRAKDTKSDAQVRVLVVPIRRE